MAECEKHTNFKGDFGGDFGCPVCWLEEREQLQAENAVLKNVLTDIKNIQIGACDKKQQGDYACNVMQEIADLALNPQPKIVMRRSKTE